MKEKSVEELLKKESKNDKDLKIEKIREMISIKNIKENIFSIVLGLFLIFSGISFIDKVMEFTTDDNKASYSKTEVIVTAKHYVKNNLKSPSSAKFCPQNELSIKETIDGIVVSGYVDSENSFGAKLRSDFTVVLTSDGKYLKRISIK